MFCRRMRAELSCLALARSSRFQRWTTNGILSWIEQLDEVDVQGVEPMTSNVHQPLRLRDDVVTDGGKLDCVLSNAPKSADGFFVVPKVVE